MPSRPLYQPQDQRQLADSLAFDRKSNEDIWKLGTDEKWQADIDALSQYDQEPEQSAQPFSALKMPDPLPVVVSERPDANRIAYQQQMQQPFAATAAPPAASGTPVAMPSAPVVRPATITQGPLPGQTLQPGESVGDVQMAPSSSLAAGNFTPDEQAAIEQAAREEGVPADLIAAIWDTEQSDATSVSDAGARGRGQVVPGQNYDLPGEDPSIPLDGARQTARALKDKYRINGSWDEAGAAYFGYGVDSGGMDTDTYRERVRQNRAKYQSAPTSSPAPAEEAPQAVQQATEATVQQAGRYARNQGEVGNELGLPWARTIEICGPVAAAAFLRRTGRMPGQEEAEAMRVAQEKGYWQPGRGMGGTATQEQLLNDLGVATKRVEGVPDWNAVAADVQRGNPVIVDAGDHYMVAEAYDPQTGQFDFGETAGFLTAARGRTKFRPDELPSLSGPGMTISPSAVIYLDNPETPAPSVVAGRTALNAPDGGTATSPSGATPPSGGSGAPSTAAGSDQQMWSPDGPAAAPGAFQAGAGRSGGQGVMYRGPSAPQEVGNDQPWPSYNDPTDQGTINQPIQPQLNIVDGRTEPPSQQGDWQPWETVPAPSAVPYGPPLSEAGPEAPPNPYGAPRDPAAQINPGAAPTPPPSPRGDPAPYGQVSSTPGEPDYVPPRPFWTPTTRERRRVETSGQIAASGDLDPNKEGEQYVLPAALPVPWSNFSIPVAPRVQRAATQALGAVDATFGAASDYLNGRGLQMWVPILTQRGIAELEFPPEKLARYNELYKKYETPWSITSGEPYRTPEQRLTPEELAELKALNAELDGRYEQIKDDPDQLTEAFNAAPNSVIYPLLTSLVAMQVSGGARAAGAGAATRLGAGSRGARAAGYAADVAVQSVADPTNLVSQPAFDAAGAAIGSTVRGARAAGRAALNAGGDAPVPQMMGSGFVPSGGASQAADAIDERAVREFGVTRDPESIGWILRDGRGLDFSDGMQHSEIARVVGDAGDPILDFAEQAGAIRARIEDGGLIAEVDASSGVTDAQKRALAQMARGAEGAAIDVVTQDGRRTAGNFLLPEQRGDFNNFLANLPPVASTDDASTPDMLGSGMVPARRRGATRAPDANALPTLPPEATRSLEDAVVAIRNRRTPEQQQMLEASQTSANAKLQEQARIKAEMQGAKPDAIKAAIKREGYTLTKAEEAARYGFTGQEEVAQALREGQVVPPQAVAGMLGQYPKYLDGVVDFIMEQREKLTTGQLTSREVAKALIHTVGSMQAGAMSVGKFKPAFGQRVKNLFIDGGKVRPEEAVAAWFLTARGRRALDSLESGNLNQQAWEDLLTLRDAYGNNTLRNMGVFVPMDRKTKTMQWDAQVPRYRDGTPKQYDLRNLNELTEAINATRGDPEALQAVVAKIKGIGPAKPGFVKHLLGFGAEATFDAVEMNLWMAGRGDTGKLAGPAADLARAAKLYSDNPEVTQLLFDQIRGRFRELREMGVGANIDESVYNHILHHWIWDKAKGLQTTHAGMYEAMRNAANAAPEEVSTGARLGMPDARNAAQGVFIGEMGNQMEEQRTGEPVPMGERLARLALGAGATTAAGRRMSAGAGLRLGSGAVPEAAGRRMRAAPNGARLAGSGFVPSEPIKIPRAGWRAADAMSEGAEDARRAGAILDAPRERMRMDDIARRAEDVLGVDPDLVRKWQDDAAARPAYEGAVRGQALRLAADIDAERVAEALDRLEVAQNLARTVENPTTLSASDRLSVADAALAAAEAANNLRRSGGADSAQARAAARELAQRRHAITARSAIETSERAQKIATEAEEAAKEVQQAIERGQLTPELTRKLQRLAEKMDDPEKNGLVDTGLSGLERLENPDAPVPMPAASGKPSVPSWGYLVQEAAEARANPGSLRSDASRYEPGLGSRFASEVGSQLVGGTTGALIGASMDEERPDRGAALGLAAGAATGFAGRRLSLRYPNRGGVMGMFGHAPTPSHPTRSTALGPSGREYTFAYRVAELDDLIASNGPGGAINPDYPPELQPRDRQRAASRVQVDNIAQKFNAKELLHDFGRLDAGPMIVGSDRVVESGNGRTMALRQVARENPEAYQQYVEMLRANVDQFGMDPRALDGIRQPVLIRERLSDVDRVKFASEANNNLVQQMSPMENAITDSGRLTDEQVRGITVKDGQTIDEALLDAENGGFIRAFMGNVSSEDRSKLIDAKGNLNADGLRRAKAALLLRTYQGEAGNRVAEAFIESNDSGIGNVQRGMLASLPAVSRAEALISAGERAADLSIADDIATAADVYARLRRAGISVGDYVAQAGMFQGRETTPVQDLILGYFHDNARSPRMIRALMDEYAAAVEGATVDPNDMFGAAVAQASKEEMLDGIVRRLGADPASYTGAGRAQGAAGTRVTVPGVQAADGSTLADDLALENLSPEERVARLQAEVDRLRGMQARGGQRRPRATTPADPLQPANLGPAEGMPATGGPEGTLAMQGAPVPPRPMPRPGAPMEAPRTGGPEGTLAVEGAPVPPSAPVRPGAPMSAPVTGGPEGRLAREGAPPEPANLPPVGDMSTGGPEGRLIRPAIPAMQGSEGTVIRQMSDDARTWMQRAREMPNERGFDSEIEQRLVALEDYSTAGRAEAARLRAAFEADRSEDAFRTMSAVERRNADNARKTAKQEAASLEAARIRGIQQQIKDVLAALADAPGAAERLQTLYADLTEISQKGFERSSAIRKRLQRQGLLRAGLASKTEDVDALVQAIARTDPNKPEEMRAVLQIISKPRLIDQILEYQYVNMLSGPVTQAVNVSANAMQIAGRLLFNNPLEWAFTGGQSSGVGAAFEGAKRGWREALPEAKQIMKTGFSSNNIERAVEMGDYGRLNREYLTEKFGKAGTALHFVSTRPLAAMDALFGHVAYSSAVDQHAQRAADRMLREGKEAVKGLDRVAAKQKIISNIWDYPEIIEKAGKIQDYTLMRSKDVIGPDYGRLESALRTVFNLKQPAEGAGAGGQAIAFVANHILPFTNVPLNAAKQGAERSVGVPINIGRAAAAYREAAKATDSATKYAATERAGELAAKATIGAGAMTAAGILAFGDNLTDDGPSDEGERKIWEQTHKRNSWRVPGTSGPWFSWEGTPFAIPFGIMAGAKRGVQEANERSAKKGQTDLGDVIGSAGVKGFQGGVEGFASQTFVRALGDQYQLMTGRQSGLSSAAAQATSSASRFLPGSGMLNFLARVSDDMERDAGRPATASEVLPNAGERLKQRIPKIAGAVGIPNRGDVDTRLDPYGEDVKNEQYGAAGLINTIPVPPMPNYRGFSTRTTDPIQVAVEKSGVGAPSGATELTIPGIKDAKLPLNNQKERRAFQQAYGKAYRAGLEAADAGAGDLRSEAISKIRAAAREKAIYAMIDVIGEDEVRRRIETARAAEGK